MQASQRCLGLLFGVFLFFLGNAECKARAFQGVIHLGQGMLSLIDSRLNLQQCRAAPTTAGGNLPAQQVAIFRDNDQVGVYG